MIAWQKAKSPTEVSKKLGMPISTTYYRAAMLRKAGIPLKCFRLMKQTIKHKIGKLKKLAEDSLTEDEK